ncbi:MAG: hypothetical protein IT381_30135 [Deltaproteobacteria bacterium]|nr:hypothetical protein [Deltaproteobacteria bacterium]
MKPKADPFEGADLRDPYVRAMKKAWGKATPEYREYMKDGWRKNDAKYRRIGDWIRQLAWLAKQMYDTNENKQSWQSRELFYVRLSGVIDELPRALKTFEADWLDGHPVSQGGRAAIRAAKSIHDALDRDELLFIDFMRQRAAHLVQSGYLKKWDHGKKKLSATYKCALLPKEQLAIDDMDTMIARVLTRHGSDAGFAKHLCNRLKPEILKLYRAIETMEL